MKKTTGFPVPAGRGRRFGPAASNGAPKAKEAVLL